MSIGLPGSGIGGVFYLVSALLMPVDGVVRAVRDRRTLRPRLLLRQATLALAIVMALLATGWSIERLIVWANTPAFALGTGTRFYGTLAVPRIFRAATFALTFGTLGVVLISVQILRLFFARPATRDEAGEDVQPEAA